MRETPPVSASSVPRNAPHVLRLLVLLCFVLPGAARAEPAPPRPPASVLLLTIDSLRPDHLGCYGYPLSTSPWIDRIAREGTRFRLAFSQGGWTSPAMVSILTGLYPSTHGVEGRPDHFPCATQAPLTAWARAGYRIPCRPAVGDESNYSRLGLQPEPDFGTTVEELAAWLRKRGPHPFFVWYHINKTPHLPYAPPDSHLELFWPPTAPRSLPEPQQLRLQKVRKQVIIPKGSVEFFPEDRPYIEALYDGEVHVADDEVGAIYRLLEQEGLLDSTVIVLTADQGEELLDHGFLGHASTCWDGTLYDEIIHVPLLVRFPPGIPSGTTVETVVQTLDILPTLGELLQVTMGTSLQGRSLLPLMRRPAGRAAGRAVAFSETSPCGYQCKRVPEKTSIRLTSVRSNAWKLIATHNPGSTTTFQLFDLEHDPEERHDVLARHPLEGGRLRDLLLHYQYENRIQRKQLLRNCAPVEDE